MTDKPILYSGPMVRALLEGRKTQTRRVLKPQPQGLPEYIPLVNQWYWWTDEDAGFRVDVPYGPGDRLWVREGISGRQYAADFKPVPAGIGEQTWFHQRKRDYSPSIHMPRWASRITLIVTDVRVERLQDISSDDAVAEGAPSNRAALVVSGDGGPPMTERAWFRDLWDSLNAKRGFGWDANPWVVALTFEVHRCNIDRMENAA